MTDEDRETISKLLDQREERFRQRLDTERSQRELKRREKTNTWMMRGMWAALGIGLLIVWTTNLVDCEARRIVQQELAAQKK